MDGIYSIDTDNSGNIFAGGYTSSTSAIATVGSHQPSNAGYDDNFLVKFNSSGVRLWGTYYGGTLGDYFPICATDSIGNVYLTGYSQYTGSSSGLSTTAAHQTSSGGLADCILVKFRTAFFVLL